MAYQETILSQIVKEVKRYDFRGICAVAVFTPPPGKYFLLSENSWRVFYMILNTIHSF